MKKNERPFIFLLVGIILFFCWTNVSYASSQYLKNGQYIVYQAEYNVNSNKYTLFLLNSTPSIFQISDMDLEKSDNNTSTFLTADNGNYILYMAKDFRISYKYSSTETNISQPSFTIHEPFSDTNNNFEFSPNIKYAPRQLRETDNYSSKFDSNKKQFTGAYKRNKLKK